MHVLRSANYRHMPWKNGKGETVEIAVFPPDATVNDFDWRISMATVAEDGPFSIFEGVDRTLSVLSGKGIELCVDGRAAVDLLPHSDPHAFPADAMTTAHLMGGPITDLNVMTRSSRWNHRVSRRTATDGPFVAPERGMTLIFVTGGCLLAGKESLSLERFDALVLQPGDAQVTFSASCSVQLFIIDLKTDETR